jgi:hypothetical protein
MSSIRAPNGLPDPSRARRRRATTARVMKWARWASSPVLDVTAKYVTATPAGPRAR